MSFALILYGPTAVGKTEFAEMLAQHIPCEIINCDAAQFYKPLSIGTAKIDWRHAAVPHHMFDVCTTPDNYSVTQYRDTISALISDIITRNKIPVFVGGSGFYIGSLLFQMARATHASAYTGTVTWAQLNNIDPIRAAQIHPHDVYRIHRALTLYQQTQMLPSELKPQYRPIIPFLFVELVRSSDDLKSRIATRVHNMFDAGWITEVESVLGTPWELFLLKKKWIGYPEIISYCQNGKCANKFSMLLETICRITWRYARKQIAYANMLVQKIYTSDPSTPVMKFNLTHQNTELYIKQLAHEIFLLQKRIL